MIDKVLRVVSKECCWDLIAMGGTGKLGAGKRVDTGDARSDATARTAFGNPVKTWVKEHHSPVSEVDIAVNHLVLLRLAAIAPDANGLLEESEHQHG